MSAPIRVTAPRRVEGGILVYIGAEDVYVSAARVCDRELEALMTVTPEPVTLVTPDGATVTGRHAGVFIAMLQGARPAEAAGRLDVDTNARVTLAAGMEVEESAPDSTPPEVDAKARCAEITLEQTRDATTAECHRRFAAAVGVPWTPDLGSEAPIVGSATPHYAVEAFREAADRAREMLRLARITPTFLHMVDVAQLEIVAATCPPRELPKGSRRYHYTDASGARRTYGETSGEAAVLAILAGSWPRVRAGDLPEEIIDRKDANIRGLARAPTKPGKRTKRKSAAR